ncbi:N-carbamoyl-L-amino-acid hydrolase [Scopulibacillus darangshiensis]|uniref:N-carbamoyl-L-amino-acid hydrolase n=1 Tax=Scopulibacillus darangshiensis TaxID=442528 RepID=A0A4V2SKT1_9BACL|nr:Zn-dependent hydrolase [Scopulibacillus darangshiensis]TCP20706.1 N-carbamoyl-L-amino-acid hydrolase [Scopulibacillus darangshiensis]
MNLNRIAQTLRQFNHIGFSEQGVNRLAFSPDEIKVKELFHKLCSEAGMTVRTDECGNVIARREGKHPEWPPVAVGSHLDTVFNGGQYDGTTGVVLGLELVRSLNDKGVQTDHPIEVICFTSEESSRFGISTIGSKAMAGKLDLEKLLKVKDHNGVTFSEAIGQAGLHSKRLENASRAGLEMKAFFEVHIEQGPRLEMEGKKIGVVTGIAAPTRLNVTVKGKASHSGTTPMSYRKDALLGAAEIILNVEQEVKRNGGNNTVATVGDCMVAPGAMNVVPEKAELIIDIRGTSYEAKSKVLNSLMTCFIRIEKKRGLDINWEVLSDEKPVILKEEVVDSLAESCEQLGMPYSRMTSGAGHDAMNMAAICPTGLIFIPCKDGLSHHKDEFALLEDIGTGGALLESEVLKWACQNNNPLAKCKNGGDFKLRHIT